MFSYVWNVLGSMNKKDEGVVKDEGKVYYSDPKPYVSQPYSPNTYATSPTYYDQSYRTPQVRTTDLGGVDVRYSKPIGVNEYRKTDGIYRGYNEYQTQEWEYNPGRKDKVVVETYSTNPNYSGKVPLASNSGCVVFNDRRIEGLIQDLNDLAIMQKADPSRLRAMGMDNLDKIILVYLWRDGGEQDLDNLCNELKKYCNGVLYLILLKDENNPGPKNINYMAPRKYSIFNVRRNGYGDDYGVDKDEKRKLEDFIRVETVNSLGNFPVSTGYSTATNVVDYRPNSYTPGVTREKFVQKGESLLATTPTRTSQLVYDDASNYSTQPVLVGSRPYQGNIETYTEEEYKIKSGNYNI